MEPSFSDQVRLVFPNYSADKRAVSVNSANQLQYLIKKCAENDKTVAPVALQATVNADVYFDNTKMAKVLKTSMKDRYVKVEPGITLDKLN